MKNILITGASGFVGGFLAEELLKSPENNIFGTYLVDESREKSLVKDKITFIKTDMMDRAQIDHLLEQSKPDYIYHLAAAASVGASFSDPIGTFHSNIDAEINLFESLRTHKMLTTRVLVFGSAESYGYVTPEDLPVDELTPLRPASPYSVSKIAQDMLALQYNICYKMPLVRIRPFNQIGPRQGLGFVASDFAKQIAQIEKGVIPPIVKVGNLDAKRDFTDIRDSVKAYQLILEKGTPGDVYNLGSGISHSAKELLEILIANATVAITIETDSTKLRPSDVPEIVCDNKKVVSLTGWKPEISFDQTVKDILDYWRNII